MSGPTLSRRAFGVLAIVALAAPGSPLPARGGASGMADSEVTIVSGSGEHRFAVEVARTAEEQTRGLMHRRRLAPDAGMLFDYGRPRNVAMWMRNTYIPLDMIFIGADWRITRIVERTVPFSLATVASAGPVRAVLEVNAGTASRLGIRPGDRVIREGAGAGGAR